MRLTDLLFVMACVLAGCGSGCDGEHRQRIEPPHAPRVPEDAAAPTVVVPAADAAAAVAATAPGYLDAPGGSLDALFSGLAAVERGEPSRVLWLFFGDSHTAGDSMTSRLRITLQSKFGDVGRGLVAAGKPPT